jgi:hypothetical protein
MDNTTTPRVGTGLTLFALGAFVFAILAQFAYTFLQNGIGAIVLFVIALALWSALLAALPAPVSERLNARIFDPGSPKRVSSAFAASAVALAFITFLLSGDNEFTPDNVLAWVLSIALFLYAFWEPEKSLADWVRAISQMWLGLRARFASGITVSWHTIALVAILLVAAFSMFYRLTDTPNEMTSDHAEKIADAHLILNGARPIFFNDGPGREVLFEYVNAIFVTVTHRPLDFFALKFGTAFAGILVVLATYLLARELFGEPVALIAAALMATSKWLMIVARIGFRSVYAPLFVALTMLFLFRALKFQKRNDFLIAGLILGTGLYTYNSFRIVPLMVAFFIVWWLSVERNVRLTDLRHYATNAIVLIGMALIVFMPMGRYMSAHPDSSWARVLTRLGTNEKGFDNHPAIIFADNVKNAVLMFNVTGDQAWPNNLPNDPALDFVTGGIFVLGVFTALYRVWRHRETMYAHMLIAILFMLMPSALSIAFPNENPGNIRALGAIPFVMIIAALPLAWLWRALSARTLGSARAQALAVILIFLGLIAFSNYRRYLVQYDASYSNSSWNASEMASVVRAFDNSIGDSQHAWIMLFPHWVDTRSVATHLGDFEWNNHTLPNADAASAQADDGMNKLFLLNMNDAANLDGLREIYPDLQVRAFRSRLAGHDFLIAFAPGDQASLEWLGSLRLMDVR